MFVVRGRIDPVESRCDGQYRQSREGSDPPVAPRLSSANRRNQREQQYERGERSQQRRSDVPENDTRNPDSPAQRECQRYMKGRQKARRTETKFPQLRRILLHGILPRLSVRTGTSFCLAFRISPCESTSEKSPSTRSNTATSAGLPGFSDAISPVLSIARAGATVASSTTFSSVRPRWRNFVIVVGRSKTGPRALYAWMSLLIVAGANFSCSAASAAAN